MGNDLFYADLFPILHMQELSRLPNLQTSTFKMVSGYSHLGQLPSRSIAIQDNCHPNGVVGWGTHPHSVNVFVCSAMKVNTS